LLDSLTTARQTASKGQIYSDVSSDDDDIQPRKERKKKLSPSLSPGGRFLSFATNLSNSIK